LLPGHDFGGTKPSQKESVGGRLLEPFAGWDEVAAQAKLSAEPNAMRRRYHVLRLIP